MGNDAQSIIAPRKIIYHMQLLDDESLVYENRQRTRSCMSQNSHG